MAFTGSPWGVTRVNLTGSKDAPGYLHTLVNLGGMGTWEWRGGRLGAMGVLGRGNFRIQWEICAARTGRMRKGYWISPGSRDSPPSTRRTQASWRRLRQEHFGVNSERRVGHTARHPKKQKAQVQSKNDSSAVERYSTHYYWSSPTSPQTHWGYGCGVSRTRRLLT